MFLSKYCSSVVSIAGIRVTFLAETADTSKAYRASGIALCITLCILEFILFWGKVNATRGVI